MATIASSIISFILTTTTVGAFLPSLKLIFHRQRHFELFIGALQLFSTLLFDITASLDIRLFGLTANNYHHVSDITTETYVCLLLIHLSGHRNQDFLTVLRYTAFSMCWFAKLGDGWQSAFLEIIVLSLFSIPPLVLIFVSFLGAKHKLTPNASPTVPGFFDYLDTFLFRRLPYNKSVAGKGLLCALAGVILLILENMGDTTLRLLHAGAQVLFGGASYFLWELLPCMDKADDLPSFR